jgi:hypothetical protein
MIAQATQVVTTYLVSAAAEVHEEIERTQHNDKMVGISVFVFLTLCLMITLSFNRDR